MVESVGGGATFKFLQALTGAAGTLSVSASDSHNRQSIRSFTITDTPQKLLAKFDDRRRRVYQYKVEGCCKKYTPDIDFRCPVTGDTGLTESTRTFVNPNLFDSPGDRDRTTSGPPTITDELTFTTTLTGSLAPKLTLSPVRHGLVDASVSALDGRTDVHKLIIGLSLPSAPDASKQMIAGKPRSGFAQGSPISAQEFEAELSVAMPISQSILRFDLRGSTIILDGNPSLVN